MALAPEPPVHNMIEDLMPLAGLVNVQWLGMLWNRVADLTPIAGRISLPVGHHAVETIEAAIR